MCSPQMRSARGSARLLLACLLTALLPFAGSALSQDFFAGKTVSVLVGTSPGGIFDITSRILAKHIGRYLPGNPTVVVVSQPGAAGATLINRLSRTVERNGLTIASINRGLPQLALVNDPSAQFDPLELTWLGSLSSFENDAYFMTINDSHPAKTVADLVAGSKPLYLGATALGSTNGMFAAIARDVLRSNIKIVGGFPGAMEVWQAMERSEVDGQFIDISAIMLTRPHLWKERKIRPLVGFGRTVRHP